MQRLEWRAAHRTHRDREAEDQGTRVCGGSGVARGAELRERSDEGALLALRRAGDVAAPHRVAAGEIHDALIGSGPDWLAAVAVTDRFDYTEGDQALRAMTFELTFSNEEGSRSSDEVNQQLVRLVASIDEGFGPRGVRQRS